MITPAAGYQVDPNNPNGVVPAAPATTPSPIAVSTLTSPQTPLNVQGPSTATIPPIVPQIAPINATPPTPAPVATDFTTKLDALQAQLSGKTLDTATTTANATAPYETQLNDVNTQIAHQQATALANQEAALRSGETTGFASREAQNIQRTDAIEMLKLSALQAGLQGNIALAEKHAQTAIDTKYGQIEQDTNTAKSNIYANYDTFTAAEKKQADATLLRLDANDAFVKQQKQDDASIMDIALKAATAGADASTLNKIQNAKSVGDATTLASPFLGAKVASDAKQQEFDNNIKLAQLAIDQRKVTDSESTAVDPSQVLAYAQQYATDGKIPTGLPKGTFGVVSQVAKELPKSDGTLVSNTTGITPSNLSSTQTDGIVALRDLQTKLDAAKTLFNSYHHGILAGIKNAVIPSTEAQQYNDLRGEIVDLLARARTGAAISASEEATYTAKLPGNFNESAFLGSNGDTKIDDLKNSLTGKLDTTLQTHSVSIYGYSKVKLGGQDYTVGQVISNGAGQQGRVNADGTITIIQ